MANDIEKAMDSLPGWVVPASIGGVVLIALFSQNKSKGPQYNSVVYGPTPSDPGLISLASREVEAKQSVVQTLINAITTRDISGIQSDRDVTIAGIGASVANERTRASENLGVVDSYNRTRATIAQAQSAADINKTNVAGATSRAHIAAKESGFEAVVNGVKDVVNKLNPFNW